MTGDTESNNETNPGKDRKRRRRGAKKTDKGLVGGFKINPKKDKSTTNTPTKKKVEAPARQPTSVTAESTPPSNKKRKRKHSKKTKAVLKLGDEGYRTPTQLRNDRKRRNKKNKQSLNTESSKENKVSASAPKQHIKGNSSAAIKSAAFTSTSVTSTAVKGIGDPSQQYISNPQSCPAVVNAKKYFKARFPELPFKVHLGPLQGWRTVSRLAVRYAFPDGSLAHKLSPPVKKENCKIEKEEKPVLCIGMFEPKSHKLIPSSLLSPAHHITINSLLSKLQTLLRDEHIKAYNESSGNGELRYLALNVHRDLQTVQLTLVVNRSGPKLELQKKFSKVDSTMVRRETYNVSNEMRKVMQILQKWQHKNNSGVLHSLFIHYHPASKHCNNIFGRDDVDAEPRQSWQCIFGPPEIVEHLCLPPLTDVAINTSKKLEGGLAPPIPYKIPLHFAPNVFRQANIDAFTDIISCIRNRVHAFAKGMVDDVKPNCLELYGGVGTIGLHVSDLVSKLISSDENPYNLSCFQKTVKMLPQEIQDIITYIPQRATDMVVGASSTRNDYHNRTGDSPKAQERTRPQSYSSAFLNADVCIVDPPRKGLDKEVLDALLNNETLGPKLLIYVSCGFPAFQRDTTLLVEGGVWKLQHAEGFVLFPGSDALETLAFLVRK